MVGQTGVERYYIDPSEPTQNGCVERFNDCMRGELPKENQFMSRAHAVGEIAAWVEG